MVTQNKINKLSYVDFVASLDEVNRPPGGKDSIRRLVQNTFLTKDSCVLDVGCNTGFCSFEIASLAKCRVVGVDINKKMIESANKFLQRDFPSLTNFVSFTSGDARRLDFKDNTFDLVMSGGSTAFMSDIPKAIQEYARVAKVLGFVGDINFYYHTKPPKKLINAMNQLMETDIRPWEIDYWLSQYQKAGLEIYHYETGKMAPVTDQKVKDYCSFLANQKRWSPKTTEEASKRLTKIMKLFNENHKYLGYGVFIMRKRLFPEVVLF